VQFFMRFNRWFRLVKNGVDAGFFVSQNGIGNYP